MRIGATLRARAPRCGAAEERVEDVAEALEALDPLEAEALSLAVHALRPEAVVGGALLGVRQYLVGLVHFLELRLGVGLLVAVGVKLHRRFAIGAFQFFAGATARDAQDFVEAAFIHGAHAHAIIGAFQRDFGSGQNGGQHGRKAGEQTVAPGFPSILDPADAPITAPEGIESTGRRTALASTFSAALELTRDGKLEMRQLAPFGEIFLKDRERAAEESTQ